MQCSDSAVVQRVRVRAAGDQILDDRTLCGWIPVRSTWAPVAGVVDRLGAASVSRSDVCVRADQQLGRRSLYAAAEMCNVVSPA